MRIPNMDWSSETILYTFGVYLDVRLKADPETVSLAVILEKAQSDLTVANAREQKANIALQAAVAARDHVDFQMERLVSKFEDALSYVVDRKHSSPMYRQFFPDGLTGDSKLGVIDRVARVKVLEVGLAGLLDGSMTKVDPAVATAKAVLDVLSPKSWIAKLSDQRLKLEASIAVWQDALVAYTHAFAAEVRERNEWKIAYRTIYAKLTELYPADRKKVESFFRRISSGKKAADKAAFEPPKTDAM